MIPAFEAECVNEAQVKGVTLSSDWSVRGLLEELREAMMDVHPAVLKTAASLRHSGTSAHVYTQHTQLWWASSGPWAKSGPPTKSFGQLRKAAASPFITYMKLSQDFS